MRSVMFIGNVTISVPTQGLSAARNDMISPPRSQLGAVYEEEETNEK